jgi:hypothetical protein
VLDMITLDKILMLLDREGDSSVELAIFKDDATKHSRSGTHLDSSQTPKLI